MIDRECLDWRVPTAEWEKFRQHVEAEFGSVEGYLGREAELAMREYADSDRYETVEEQVDRLVRAAGRTPSDLGSNKKISELESSEKTRVQVRVDPHIKEQFTRAAEDGENALGVTFARAISTYRDGGRAARLDRKLDRVVDDAEDLLAELDSGNEGGLSAVERRTVTICNRLEEQFTDDVLVEEISDVVSSTKRASEPTIEKYRERVVDRLEVEPHPVTEQNPNTDAERLWIPKERAAEIAPDGVPQECRQPVEMLNRNERIRRIQLTLGRRAAKRNTGKVTARTSTIHEDVLDRVVSRSTVLDLMEVVALDGGYRIDRSGDSAALRVDLQEVGEANPELFETIIEYRDAESESLLAETTETTVSDFTEGPSPDAVQSELETLQNAMTDGGGPKRDREGLD